MNRRHFLSLSATGALAAFGVACGGDGGRREAVRTEAALEAAGLAPEGAAALAAEAGLAGLAAEKGILFGAATHPHFVQRDADLRRILAADAAILAPTGGMQWKHLRPGPDRFDFSEAGVLLDFAAAHGLAMRGHSLVWHKALPPWLTEARIAADADALLREHIRTTVGRFAPALMEWDVVNEAVEPEDGRDDGLRNTPWLAALGPAYLDIAFEEARQAAPEGGRVLNDFGLEPDTRRAERRRTAMLRLLEGLLGRGVPVTTLGLQAHLAIARPGADWRPLQRFIREVEAMGLDVAVTELDVADDTAPHAFGVRDEQVADTYRAFLDAVLSEQAVRTVVTWGISDRYTWIGRHRPRADEAPVRPLPYDAQMRRKPAWHAIAQALSGAPRRERPRRPRPVPPA